MKKDYEKNAGKSARRAALNVLMRVSSTDAYADILLDKELKAFGPKDASFATELGYGVLRRCITLDWLVDRFSAIKAKRLELRVLNALRLGLYQIYFLTKVPASAAINESVELVKNTTGSGKAGFVNAVLRKAAQEKDSISFPVQFNEPLKHVSINFSHPEWLVRRWIERFGVDSTIELCNANLNPPPKTIRANLLKNTRQGLMDELKKEGFSGGPTRFSPSGIFISDAAASKKLNPWDERFYIQDEASQIVPLLLSLSPGQTILDACAAPGGKAAHIAEIMGDTGIVYALDKREARLKTLKDSLNRLGITIVRPIEADSTMPLGFIKGEKRRFDATLVDAPCSGLGVLRRVPDIKMKRKEADLKALSEAQSLILQNISGYVKKAGLLVYSVCSTEPEETIDVVKGFLEKNKMFEIEDARGVLPDECSGLVDERGFLLTLPHKHDMDGFFAARLRCKA